MIKNNIDENVLSISDTHQDLVKLNESVINNGLTNVVSNYYCLKDYPKSVIKSHSLSVHTLFTRDIIN